MSKITRHYITDREDDSDPEKITLVIDGGRTGQADTIDGGTAVFPSRHEWIPVGERLPEMWIDVLVYWGNGQFKGEYWIGHLSNLGTWHEPEYATGNTLAPGITHWQPLPERPE